MSSTFRDRVWMSVSGTPGTGAVTLGSAQAGYQSAAAAGVLDQETNTWVFVDGTAWEISSCVYTSSGTSLARTLISSSTGSLISLTSSATAMLTATSRDIMSTGAFAPTLFGTGADGDVTITGATTLSRDMNYRNLTLASGAAINTAGFRIFVSQNLDATAAPAGAIAYNGATGTIPATLATSASNVGALANGNVGGGPSSGQTGRAGSTTNGTAGATGQVGDLGGSGGGAGASGAGSGGTGQAAISNPTAVSSISPPYISGNLSTIGYTSIAGRTGGAMGAVAASGGGDTTNRGGATASPAQPGGNVFIRANIILRGGSTAVGAIQAKGGPPAAGLAPSTGNCGGGGGVGGSGGGFVDIACHLLLGSTAANAVDVSPGDGGAGTNGIGTGVGGDGGNSGQAGFYRLTVLSTGTSTIVGGTAQVTGSAHSGTSAGTGGTLTARYAL